jgi:two-component system osmolarity sensor histidine kinase EnvZ
MSGADESMRGGMSTDVEEMDQVIGQFLDFARGEDERDEPVDIDALLVDVLDHYALLGRNVTLLPGQAGTWQLRRLSVRRAIINLVDNALRHAGEPVQIAARRAGDCASSKCSTAVLESRPTRPSA